MLTVMLVLVAHPVQILLVVVTLRHTVGALAGQGRTRRMVRNQAEILPVAA
jgi:hypothetical protein